MGAPTPARAQDANGAAGPEPATGPARRRPSQGKPPAPLSPRNEPSGRDSEQPCAGAPRRGAGSGTRPGGGGSTSPSGSRGPAGILLPVLTHGLAAVVAQLWVVFSHWFAQWLDQNALFGPQNDPPVYVRAPGFRYEGRLASFDTTFATYATDYALAVLMLYSCYRLLAPTFRASDSVRAPVSIGKSQVVRRRNVAACLFLQLLSVLIGGGSHQAVGWAQERGRAPTGDEPALADVLNTLAFAAAWRGCVVTVGVVSVFHGGFAAELHRDTLRQWETSRGVGPRSSFLRTLPVVPQTYFGVMGAVFAAQVLRGGFACQRPAADIFVVGATQFFSTVYVLFAAWLASSAGPPRSTCPSTDGHSSMGSRFAAAAFFFLGNTALIVAYPWMLFLGWPLGTVNTVLHAWLALTWGGQAWALDRWFCGGFGEK